jgi:hypothetical protein
MMSVDIQQIEAIRGQALGHIEDLLGNSGPTITVNGEEMPWAPLLAALEQTVEWCDRKLAEYQPYEVRSRGES